MKHYIFVGAIIAGGFIAGLLWYPLLFSTEQGESIEVLVAEECVELPSPPAFSIQAETEVHI